MSLMTAEGKKIIQVALQEDVYEKLRKFKFANEKDSFSEAVRLLLERHKEMKA